MRFWHRLRPHRLGIWLCALFTGLTLTAPLDWPFDLSTYFQPQYAVVLVPLALWSLIRRDHKASALAIVALAWNLFCIAPQFAAAPASSQSGLGLRVLLTNVHRRNEQSRPLLELIRREAPDVVVAVETDQRWLDALATLDRTYPHSVARPRDDNSGIALWSRYPGDFEVQQDGHQVARLHARLQTPAGEVQVVAVHAFPPINRRYQKKRDRQLAELVEVVGDVAKPTIVLGDFNATPWTASVVDLRSRTGLHDARQGQGFLATWPTSLGWFGVPIDHVLHSQDIVVRALRVGPDIGSDHLPLIADIVVAQ